VRGLVREGWEVSVAAALRGNDARLPSFARQTPDIHVVENVVALRDAPRYLRYLIESRRPDVVLASNGEFAELALPYLRHHCPEPLYVDHCDAVRAEAWSGRRRRPRRLDEWVHHHVTPSPALSARLAGAGVDPARISAIRSGFDSTDWAPDPTLRRLLREHWGVDDETPVVLTGSILSGGEEPHLVLRTLLALRRRGLEFEAVILGDEVRSWLERQVQAQGLAGRVSWVGGDPQQLRAAMAASDAYFLPALREVVPLEVFQAMASGLPVVTADVPGGDEFLPHTALLVRASELEASVARYADTLERLLTDSDWREQMQRKAQERVRAELAPERSAKELARMLESLAASPPPLTRPAAALAEERAGLAVEYLRLARAVDTHVAGPGLRSRQHEAGPLIEQVLAQTLETSRALEDREGWIRELERAKRWLEEQRDNWMSLAEERDAALDTLEEERRRWFEIAERRGVELAESERRVLGLTATRERLNWQIGDLTGRLRRLAGLPWPRLLKLRLSRGWSTATELTTSEEGGGEDD